MKKLIYIIISLYIVIGALCLIFLDDKSDVINYFTVDMDYSRLMSEEETISFSVFIDNNKNFLIDKNNISSLSLRNNEIVISLDLIEFSEVENNIKFQNKFYYQYLIEVGFNEINLMGLNLAIEEAYLDINDLNGVNLSVSIGDLYLLFKDIEIDNYLDYNSMSCLTKIIKKEKYVGTVVMKLNNLTNNDIEIIDIRTNNQKIDFNTKNYYFSETKPVSKVSDIIPEYPNLELQKEKFVLNEEGYYVFPTVYKEGFEKLFRFPIIIEYRYNGLDYELYIDDYLFLNEMVNFDEYVGNINTYMYQYQESN